LSVLAINQLKILLAVLKYCAIALQAAVEEKLRNNTIEDPEFKQALSDLNPDVIYEKLKVICKRNPKEKFILVYAIKCLNTVF